MQWRTGPTWCIVLERRLNYDFFGHKKHSLTVQGYSYEEIYLELEEYICPLTNIIKIAPTFFIQEACKCRALLKFNPNPKRVSEKYFNCREDWGSFRIGKGITQVYLYNPWSTGSLYLYSERRIDLLPGTNIVCICFYKYKFQKLREQFGDNNLYNITLTGGPLHRLVKVSIKNNYKVYFILYKKFHVCDDYNSQDLVPTLLELGKSALISGNIDNTHNNFQSFTETIPRSIQLAPVYPIHVRLQYFDYLFYQFNDCKLNVTAVQLIKLGILYTYKQ